MRTTFIDSQKEDSFTNDGYCVVEFLNPLGLDKVQDVIKELGFGINSEEKFRKSIIHDSVDKKKKLFEKLFPVSKRAADNFLQNYKILQIAIFDKSPEAGGISFHQHTNIIDESKYRSLSIWVPLIETTVEMGTLYVVKGSHKIFNHVRSINDYRAFDNVSTKVMKKYSTPLLLKEGQAVIFDDRLIHWSPPNKSFHVRTAVRLLLIPEEADLAIHYRINEKELLKYAINEKFYREAALTIDKPDDKQVIGKLNQATVSYRDKQFISLMQTIHSDSPGKKRNLYNRLFG